MLLTKLKLIFNKNYFLSALYLIEVNFKKQYRASFLGRIWSLLQPLLQLIIMAVIFPKLLNIRSNDYPLYLISGLLPWNFLVSSIINGGNSFIARENIIKKTTLSRSIFTVADTFGQLYLFMMALVSMYIIIFAFCKVPVHLTIILLPIAMIPLILTALFMASAFAYISVYARDIPYLISVLSNVAFWTVPIAYFKENVPENIVKWIEYNPLYWLISPMQKVIYFGQIPGFYDFFKASIVAISSLCFSFFIYNKLKNKMVYYL